MKRVNTALLCVLLLTTVSWAQLKQEMRAVWLTNVDSYVMFSDEGITTAMNYLAAKGFNVVFPVVWNNSYTLYPSRVMDSLFGGTISPSFSGRDPLERIIFDAHRNGIEVIPWFEYGFSSSYSANGGRLLAKYPSWAAKDQSGNLVVKNGFDWMAGTNPVVQNFLISLVTEVIDKYDVDGIQGDDRLPAMPIEAGYDSTTRAIYRSENGGIDPPGISDNTWKLWRAKKLTRFLQRMRDSVRTRGQQLLYSMAPSPYPFGYDNYLQDAKTWVDSGYIDNFIPQLYRQTTNQYAFELDKALSYVPTSKRNIFFGGILGKSGTYVFTPDVLLGSVNANRTRGINGESFFFYEAFPYGSGVNGDTIGKTVYKDAAIPPYRNGKIWRPKASITNEDDTANTRRTGNWSRVAVAGYNPGIYWTNDSAAATFSYYFNVPAQAWYDIYAYLIPNSAFTQTATYTVYGLSDSQQTVVNQRNPQNTKWVKLGSALLAKGRQKVVTVDNRRFEAGKYVLADAALAMINRKKSPDAIISDAADESHGATGKPADYLLLQNYPNPFNPTTTLRFSLPEAGDAVLSVYSVLGEAVATVHQGYLSEGLHEATFQATGLASGIYFAELRSGTAATRIKMILVR